MCGRSRLFVTHSTFVTWFLLSASLEGGGEWKEEGREAASGGGSFVVLKKEVAWIPALRTETAGTKPVARQYEERVDEGEG